MPLRTGVTHAYLDEDVRAFIANTSTDPVPVQVVGAGGGTQDVNVTNEVEVKNDVGNPLTVSGTVALDSASLAALETINVGNFPATQQVSGTVAATQSGTWSVGRTWSLASAGDSVTTVPSGTQTVSGTVTANLGTLNGAATAANQTTTNTTLSSLDGKTPDESGTWGYNAGTSGTVAVAANKRVLAITATAPTLAAASMTINGGQTITIPAGTSITITPRANLTAPTLVFTSTASYFVEFVE